MELARSSYQKLTKCYQDKRFIEFRRGEQPKTNKDDKRLPNDYQEQPRQERLRRQYQETIKILPRPTRTRHYQDLPGQDTTKTHYQERPIPKQSPPGQASLPAALWYSRSQHTWSLRGWHSDHWLPGSAWAAWLSVQVSSPAASTCWARLGAALFRAERLLILATGRVVFGLAIFFLLFF